VRRGRGSETPLPHHRPSSLGKHVVNGLFAALLLATSVALFVSARTEGAIDETLLSPERIARALGSGERGVVAVEVLPGRYPRPGRGDLVYVRGTLRNVSASAHARPVVEVRMLSATGDLLATVRAAVGEEPTPADLWSIEESADVQALIDRVEASAVKEMAPGASLPFFAIFLSAPSDTSSGLRFEVRPRNDS
jgi:hypothetical protein